MKTCFKCRRRKSLSEFYAHPFMADGHLGKCKVCAKADVSARRAVKIDAVRAYDRKRSALPHRRRANSKRTKEWRAKYPGRSAAQTKALRHHRKAPRCCQMCGLVKRLERHHPDYALPLLIVWLCKPCHKVADDVRKDRERSSGE